MSRSARLLLAAGLLAGPAALGATTLGTVPASAAAGGEDAAGAGAGASAARGPATRASATSASATSAAPGLASVAITSVSPGYARPGQKVTVRGVLRNASRTTLRDVTVQLRSSSQALTDRADLTSYIAGAGASDVPEAGALTRIRGPVRPGTSAAWTAVLPAGAAGMTVFGVYPLAAQALSGGTPVAISRTLLPFWPTGREADQPRENIAWLWPLADTPQQGPCPGLLSNSMAGSLAAGGRLDALLQAGSGAAGRADKITWVIDPAVLSSAQSMTVPYVTGSDVSCRHGSTRPASAAAASWLGQLRTAVTGQPAVILPYADVDIAALVQQNLAGDIREAYADGRSIATQVLRRSVVSSAAGSQDTAADLTASMAWPADGLASYPMLETLAATDGIRAVVLSSAAMPPLQTLQYTPSAVSATPDGEGGDMRVLLADSTLTQILGSVTERSAPGAVFAARQLFLAETAMIAAEAPHLSRAIVVAPPQLWSPPASLAAGVLADTGSAPWLVPVSAGTLAAGQHASGQVPRAAPDRVGTGLVSPALLRGVVGADHGVQLVQSLRAHPAPRLNRAISGIESAALRGTAAGQRQAQALLRRVSLYVARQAGGISLIEPGRDTLGGSSGSIPVSVDNRLPYPVRVRVSLSFSKEEDGGFAVLAAPGTFTIPAATISTKKVKVRAPFGSTTISLRLTAPDGQPLPAMPVNMVVQSTHFGNLALIVAAAALGVFVITSASRALRRGHAPMPDSAAPDSAPAGRPAPADPGTAAAPGGTGGSHNGTGAPAASAAIPSSGPHATAGAGHEKPVETDTVGHDRAAPSPAGTDLAATEDADDYARATGWADSR